MNNPSTTPDPFEAAYAEGSRLFDQGRYTEAIDAFARVMAASRSA